MSFPINSAVKPGPTYPNSQVTAHNPDGLHDTLLGGHPLAPEAAKPTVAVATDAKASTVQISLGSDLPPIFPEQSISTLREMRDALCALPKKTFGSSLHKDEERLATRFERDLPRYLKTLYAMNATPAGSEKIGAVLRATTALKTRFEQHEKALNQAAEHAYAERNSDDDGDSAPRGLASGMQNKLGESAKAIAQQKQVLLNALESLTL
jgi:hypothetical protein